MRSRGFPTDPHAWFGFYVSDPIAFKPADVLIVRLFRSIQELPHQKNAAMATGGLGKPESFRSLGLNLDLDLAILVLIA